MQTRVPSPREIRFSELSQPRQILIRLCQWANFGSIREVDIRDGEPVFDPSSIVLVDIKLGGDDQARKERDLPDFVLSREVLRMMDLLDELVTTKIESLEIQAGLPRRVVFRVVGDRAGSGAPGS